MSTTNIPASWIARLLRTLASSEWVRQKLNLVFTGPTGIGKSWLACALAQKASGKDSRFCTRRPRPAQRVLGHPTGHPAIRCALVWLATRAERQGTGRAGAPDRMPSGGSECNGLLTTVMNGFVVSRGGMTHNMVP